MSSTKTKNFDLHCDYLEKLCEKTKTKCHKYDVGFTIYPDGYGDTDDKNYFFIMIKRKKFDDNLGKINYKDCINEDLLNYLIDFKNGIIDKKFCLNKITDYRSNGDDELKFVVDEDK